jgi:hypothetical protein
LGEVMLMGGAIESVLACRLTVTEALDLLFSCASYVHPAAVTPVTVNVNVPEVAEDGELKLNTPELFVKPDTVALTSPLQLPATVAPDIGFPATSLIVTVAVAETAAEALLDEIVNALT